jgi:hypothetical protein
MRTRNEFFLPSITQKTFSSQAPPNCFPIHFSGIAEEIISEHKFVAFYLVLIHMFMYVQCYFLLKKIRKFTFAFKKMVVDRTKQCLVLKRTELI